MSTTITRPDFRSVAIAPIPATINTAFTITVDVADIVVALEAEPRYSGEFYSGEDEWF